jgi:hypothetical protein
MGLPLWMGVVPDYEVINDNMQITVGDFTIACPVNVFLVGCAKGRAAIVRWERERQNAEVIKFPAADTSAAH